MASLTTDRYIHALDCVLGERYPKTCYSLNGYQDDSVCLKSELGAWSVFYGERGNRFDESKCSTILEACIQMIRKFTHRTEDISNMENELVSIVGSKEES